MYACLCVLCYCGIVSFLLVRPVRVHVFSIVSLRRGRSQLYVVTPYHFGGDLLKMVAPHEGTGEPNAAKWSRQILLGLAYVHNKVRPGNAIRQAGTQAGNLPIQGGV